MHHGPREARRNTPRNSLRAGARHEYPPPPPRKPTSRGGEAGGAPEPYCRHRPETNTGGPRTRQRATTPPRTPKNPLWAGPQDEYGRTGDGTRTNIAGSGTRIGISYGWGPRTSTDAPSPPPRRPDPSRRSIGGAQEFPCGLGPGTSTSAPREYPARRPQDTTASAQGHTQAS